jgi:hypothetical protein
MISLRIPNRSVVPADFRGRPAVCQNLDCQASLEPPYQSIRLCLPGWTLETLLCANCLPPCRDGSCPEVRLEAVEANPVMTPADRHGAAPAGDFACLTTSQLDKDCLGMCWGEWAFDPQDLTLTHLGMGYEIDLRRIQSSAAILDWIFQLLDKSWADAGTMHDLLRAFAAILRPQANYCPGEVDKRADGGQLATEFASRVQQQRDNLARVGSDYDYWLANKRPIEV